jgi:hypothetical protein
MLLTLFNLLITSPCLWISHAVNDENEVSVSLPALHRSKVSAIQTTVFNSSPIGSRIRSLRKLREPFIDIESSSLRSRNPPERAMRVDLSDAPWSALRARRSDHPRGRAVPLSVSGYAYDAGSTPWVAPTVPPDRLTATGSPSLKFVKRWLGFDRDRCATPTPRPKNSA